ncbi:Hypothetical predicted protein [Marmota monax]|uniref:Signal recognition particle 9 kDa protein n=1 Tax=Marmota monax TaxID=9995 RepID=A0A5E4AQP0_MARMO|nr:signal recognition particle 9 kDa protein [Marmota monax]VTJ58979.1 Hypothetical predicted protein [Marmota monax]
MFWVFILKRILSAYLKTKLFREMTSVFTISKYVFLFQARVVLKYRHSDGSLCIKVTDDLVCLVYRTDQAQDVKKIEKFHSQLMRLMVAKESRSVAMETD